MLQNMYQKSLFVRENDNTDLNKSLKILKKGKDFDSDLENDKSRMNIL